MTKKAAPRSPGHSPRPAQRPGARMAARRPDYAELLSQIEAKRVELSLRNEDLQAAATRAAEAAERFADLFDYAPLGYVSVDARGAILAANLATCRLLGEDRAQLAGAPFTRFVAPPERSVFDGFVANGFRRKPGDTSVCELALALDSRERVDVRLTATQVFRNVPELLFAIEDISGRKRAQEIIRRSEERFRALIERSNDMIQVLDADGRYRFWSKNAAEEVGWTPDDLMGKSALQLVHDEDRERVQASLAGLLRVPGAVARETYRLRCKDGSWLQVESVARNLEEDPAVRGVVVNSRNVTAQRLLEHQLQQAQKLESLGRLAGGVAHDFNNLLTVILACSEELKEKLASADDPGAREAVESIHAAGERARDLTQQLLAFARKQVVAAVPLDLNVAVERAKRILDRLLGEDVELRVKAQPTLWPILADPGQLEQVLLNLAVNARDAMPNGGTLVIETRTCLVREGSARTPEGPPTGEWVQLVVRDSGMGMPREVREHLFEPFFTTKERGKGTGLGLATVYGIVVQAGAHIHVASEPECGTTFQISFPRTRREARPEPHGAALAATRGTESVLVVEDDARVREVIVRVLAREGYRVFEVGHPGMALEMTETELRQFRLLVTDVVMPGMDGGALAGVLQRRSPGLRVLYLSGYPGDATSERGLVEPGAPFLAKPFARSALVDKVRAILDEASE